MPHIALAAVALALSPALAGCAHTIRVGSGRRLDVTLTEYRIDPGTVRAYAGRLTIEVRNLGTRTHNLAVSLGNVNEAVTRDLTPGSSTAITVDLAPGEYMLRSLIAGDQALGEWGSLDIVSMRHG